MGDISKNFSFSEFERSTKAIEKGIENKIPSDEVRENITSLVECVLQPLRDSLGARIDINSGYRCKKLNELVGGTEKSQHRKGEAADIKSPFYTPLDIARRIFDKRLPYDQMILYPTFVHVSHKRNGQQRGHILYNQSYKGEKM